MKCKSVCSSQRLVYRPSPTWLDVYYAVLACLRTWLNRVLADLERVNAPVGARTVADSLKASLAELERAGAAHSDTARRIRP
jgi:hypothetical protein